MPRATKQVDGCFGFQFMMNSSLTNFHPGLAGHSAGTGTASYRQAAITGWIRGSGAQTCHVDQSARTLLENSPDEHHLSSDY